MDKKVSITIDADIKQFEKKIDGLKKKLKTINSVGSFLSKQFAMGLYSLTILGVCAVLGHMSIELSGAVTAINGAWGWREHVKAKNGK